MDFIRLGIERSTTHSRYCHVKILKFIVSN